MHRERELTEIYKERQRETHTDRYIALSWVIYGVWYMLIAI